MQRILECLNEEHLIRPNLGRNSSSSVPASFHQSGEQVDNLVFIASLNEGYYTDLKEAYSSADSPIRQAMIYPYHR